MSVLVFWFVMTCGLVGGYQHFRERHCLHLQDWSALKVETVCFSKTVVMTYTFVLDCRPEDSIDFFTAVRTSNLICCLGVTALDHPSYITDLAQCNFYLFLKVKGYLRWHYFLRSDGVKMAVKISFCQQDTQLYRDGTHEPTWMLVDVCGLRKCYVEK